MYPGFDLDDQVFEKDSVLLARDKQLTLNVSNRITLKKWVTVRLIAFM